MSSAQNAPLALCIESYFSLRVQCEVRVCPPCTDMQNAPQPQMIKTQRADVQNEGKRKSSVLNLSESFQSASSEMETSRTLRSQASSSRSPRDEIEEHHRSRNTTGLPRNPSRVSLHQFKPSVAVIQPNTKREIKNRDREILSVIPKKLYGKSSSLSSVKTTTVTSATTLVEKGVDTSNLKSINKKQTNKNAPIKHSEAGNPFRTTDESNEKSSTLFSFKKSATPIEAPLEKHLDILVNDNTELRNSLINRCEEIVLWILEQLSAGRMPSVSYRISTIETLMDQLESQNVSVGNDAESSVVAEACSVFETPESMESNPIENEEPLVENPGQRTVVDFGVDRSRNKFALMMTTMAKVHELLQTNNAQTRRSFYYELKGNENISQLVTGQRQVDSIVNSLANLLDCSPWETGLVASEKGLVAGDMTLKLFNDCEINCGSLSGALIPRIISNVISIRTRAKFVIVVEKDTVFQKLLEENCPNKLDCILITGKGFPDVATRMLVKILAEKLELPVYALVDSDPFGIEILFTYKYGSITLSVQQESLACPSIRWLGLHPSEVRGFLDIQTIPLSQVDKSKLKSLQSRPYIDERFLRQLKIMKKGKAEIEAIVSDSQGTSEFSFYLQMKIESGDYI